MHSRRNSDGAILSLRRWNEERRNAALPIAPTFSRFLTSSILMNAGRLSRPQSRDFIELASLPTRFPHRALPMHFGFQCVRIRNSNHTESYSKSAGTAAWRLEFYRWQRKDESAQAR